MKAIGVLGTGSSVGKTWVATALCAWLHREGVLSDDELAQRLAVVDAMDPARGVPGPEPGARLN